MRPLSILALAVALFLGAPARPAPAKPRAPAWQRCPARRHFGCETRSQGMAPAPGETIPEVCGCIPRCPRPRPILVAQQADGTWPDGSLKGAFTCAESGLP